MELDTTTIIAISTAAYALFSEVVGLNKKWKANSVIQVILSIGKSLLGKK